MTVKELIKILLRQDQDADVVFTATWEKHLSVPGSIVCLGSVGDPLFIRDPGAHRLEIYNEMQRECAVDVMPLPEEGDE